MEQKVIDAAISLLSQRDPFWQRNVTAFNQESIDAITNDVRYNDAWAELELAVKQYQDESTKAMAAHT